MAQRAEPDWVQHVIWWQIYPLGFTGAHPDPHGHDEHRLLRILGWLDHAIELGCSGIKLGPIFAAESHGYDTVDHFRIDPRLGTDDDFDRLVAEAHGRGLKIQLDGVFNHVGRGHPLAAAALRDGPDSDAARRLRTTGSGDDRRFVPFEGHDILVTLNHDDDEVRRITVDVMRHWLDRGADAWRLDAAYAVPTRFWAQVLPEVRTSHPDVWFEAEVIHGDYAGFVADSTADTVTQYELWKAIWSAINDRNLFELAWAMTRHSEMLEAFVPATFIGNHDVTRIASQIADARHLDHAIVLLAVLGGTPSVYAGDEYGFTGVKDERVGGDDEVRPPFPSTPGELEYPDERIYRLHQRLIGFRRRYPWLHRATTEQLTLANEHATWAVTADGQRLEFTLNLGDQPVGIDSASLLDSDDATRDTPGSVAPHGWAICGG
ncbi:alpha-amylase family protein [Gordonia sp. NPDC003950]